LARLTVNVILVGPERFTSAERQKVDAALAIVRTTYLAVGVGVSFGPFVMPLLQAGPLIIPTSGDDAEALTKKVAGG